MKYRVSYSALAYKDLRSIYGYISTKLKAPLAAADTVANIRDKIKELDTFPEKHPIRKLISRNDIRQLSVSNFVVLYIVDKKSKEVLVARILYGGRDIDKLNTF